MSPEARPRLVLASGSATRAKLLRDAGLEILVDPPAVDEGAVKRRLRAEGASVETVALCLADAKAGAVSPARPGALVIGADQMLERAGEWFDKPTDRAAAAAQLARLGGGSHRLVTAATIHRDGEAIWRVTTSATLTLRPLSPALIDAYLDRVGDDALASVGAYRIEGPALALFDAVEGDWFTILGLPMREILSFLRPFGLPFGDAA